MLKSWLESSKDFIVGPGIQRQDLFPEEHQAVFFLSELAPPSTGDYLNLILQGFRIDKGCF